MISILRIASVLATPCVLTGCLLASHPPADGPEEYPITPGRYYRAAELDTLPRDSALQFEDYGDSGVYAFTSFSRPGCRNLMQTGIWYVRMSSVDSGLYLRREGHKFRQSNPISDEDCLTGDSLILLSGPYVQGQFDQIRNITDSSFETCMSNYKICFQLCATASTNPDSECFHHQSTPDDSALWIRYVK